MTKKIASFQPVIRKNFKKFEEVLDLPYLMELQQSSYDRFLQKDIAHEKRENIGLQKVFNRIFPISSTAGDVELQYCGYEIGNPEFDVDECLYRGLTYSAPLRISCRLILWDIEQETGVKTVNEIKEQTIYLGEMPDMTKNGTFVVNGVERVVVSQVHRSPGIFCDGEVVAGIKDYTLRIIPYMGSWIDFEMDSRGLIYMRVDRKKKILLSTILQCLEKQSTQDLKTKAGLLPYEPSDSDDIKMENFSKKEILSKYYATVEFNKDKDEDGWTWYLDPEHLHNCRLNFDLMDADNKKVLFSNTKKLNSKMLQRFKDKGCKKYLARSQWLLEGYFAQEYSISDEVKINVGDKVTQEALDHLTSIGQSKISLFNAGILGKDHALCATFLADKNNNRDEALMDLHSIMRPGDPATVAGGERLLFFMIFDPNRNDLSTVGRIKINERLGLSIDENQLVLTTEDLLQSLGVYMDLLQGKVVVDDIDNLANRRIRAVGEMLENHYYSSMSKIERIVQERMSVSDISAVMPNDLINMRPASAAVKDFFGSSQLSQFMDQTNPLSEVTHKRRISALGPGGLSRERAGFAVRDVHPTHYGRICPIETPEGQNIGLINSLATFARVNRHGFIETPYRKVENGTVTDKIEYLSPSKEWGCIIAQPCNNLDAKGKILDELVSVRYKDDYLSVKPEDIDWMDVSPKQLISVATSLIPFLENDDASRALMGSNMQRQAVPLLNTDAPLIGTGMEKYVANDSNVIVKAFRDGVVVSVDASKILVRTVSQSLDDISETDVYTLSKFKRTNHNTCINQRPVVMVGEKVQKGQLLADGPSTQGGELALGKNVLVAFSSWSGYNFEDSIIVSEKVVGDGLFTSLHIEEFEVPARDTKLGPEEITRDIPNVGAEILNKLDESGIITIGSQVQGGDVLVGRVTPKGETVLTPEEKLLMAVFGEKASDVKDSSLRVPPGVSGTVVDVRVFNRRGIEKDQRSAMIDRKRESELTKEKEARKKIVEDDFCNNVSHILSGQILATNFEQFKQGETLSKENLENLKAFDLKKMKVQDTKVMERLKLLSQKMEQSIKLLQKELVDKTTKLGKGDYMPAGILKVVKVFLAVKRKLQPGDKMAGRHGNKGVVSYVAPIEDMPFLEDGNHVDIILNPLGLPSRMNVGQILEVHLGLAAKSLGTQINSYLAHYNKQTSAEDKNTVKAEIKSFVNDIYKGQEKEIAEIPNDQFIDYCEKISHGVPMATPVFESAKLSDIEHYMDLAGLDKSGQAQLFDGRTGLPFDDKSTVGYMYMLKLHHLVDEKLHARSIGPYSLVTQQPLGGKAQFGGQRFGEMEVWALEAYGASYTLQEMLTVKSDDIDGRAKVYQSIIKGENDFEPTIPESFKVLMKELKALGINIRCDYKTAVNE